ncbi:MAG: DNA cytosine methyltransferase [Clostridia bacterium]|nr:DNA cytosine methyltransferase [Clostridia bacterium]
MLDSDFKYIDLFAGIGGFHCAMNKFSNGNARCVMASEIDSFAQNMYRQNFGIEPLGDIRKIKKNDIKEDFDVVCGGFPCQTFSKAGMQKGFGDPRGTLFREIVRLIHNEDINKQPKLLILENVRNLISHDNGVTWKTIRKALQDEHYNVIEKPLVLGPKDFGIPQLRDRAIILAVRTDIYDKPIDLTIERKKPNTTSIYDIIDKGMSKKEQSPYLISDLQKNVLDMWDAFIKGIKQRPLGFPIWSDEFGDNRDISDLPLWKQDFINKNRKLYIEHKAFIDEWLQKYKVREYVPTYRKFEWQVGNKLKSVYEGIIQFRPSGIRVKLPTESPTLVAMVHRPIIGKYKRYLTIKETAALQSFPENYNFSGEAEFQAYKQLGNAVNVEVIYQSFKQFVNYLENNINREDNNAN